MQPTLLPSGLAALSLPGSLSVSALYMHLVLAPGRVWAAGADFLPGSELDLPIDHLLERNDFLQPSYEPEFASFNRGIIGRAPSTVVAALRNNVPEELNINFSETKCYLLEGSTIFGTMDIQDPNAEDGDGNGESQRRQDQPKTVYFSANTCIQPKKPGETEAAPQLKLMLAAANDGGCPTSTDDMSDSDWVEFEEGAASIRWEATGDVYVVVGAPDAPDAAEGEGFQGVYNFQVAASVDDYYHMADTTSTADGSASADLLWMDSDSSAALLVTRNLTDSSAEAQHVMSRDPPYELFVENEQWRVFDGVRRSVCGMREVALISANKDGNGRQSDLVRTTMTTRGPGGMPKQEFYFEGLNQTSAYNAVLVRWPESANSQRRDEGEVRGGGVVYPELQFRTLTGTTCKIMTDLEFCDETTYAVPGSDDFNGTELARMYDDYARSMYDNFEKVMMQIPCEADSTSRYSLAADCDDCRQAYKRWLCTVSIPRCEDVSSDNSYAIMRNVGEAFPNGTSLPDDERNSDQIMPWNKASRNRFIDSEIKPGPYREILPCEDICYDVVRSCPAAIGFLCPRPGYHGFEGSYQREEDGAVSCNSPGRARTTISGAPRLQLQATTTRALGAVALSAAALLIGVL